VCEELGPALSETMVGDLAFGFGGPKNQFATVSWDFSSQISQLLFLDQNFHFPPKIPDDFF